MKVLSLYIYTLKRSQQRLKRIILLIPHNMNVTETPASCQLHVIF